MWNLCANKKAAGAALWHNIGRSGHIEISVFPAAYSRRRFILLFVATDWASAVLTCSISVFLKSSVS